MKWFDQWFYAKIRDMWDNRDHYDQISIDRKYKNKVARLGTAQMVEHGAPEGHDTIRFELSSAVGGKILTVRRYDDRKENSTSQTYVIPTGEDLGDRVAKIINMEQYRG